MKNNILKYANNLIKSDYMKCNPDIICFLKLDVKNNIVLCLIFYHLNINILIVVIDYY